MLSFLFLGKILAPATVGGGDPMPKTPAKTSAKS